MFITKHIKYLLVLSLALVVFCTQLTSAQAALIQLSNDNGTAAGFFSSWQGGHIIGTILTPNSTWSYPVQVDSVQFMLHRFSGAASSATVKAHVYSVVGGAPGTLLGSSAPATINTFYPNWTSINLTSANITLSSPAPFMVAIEYIVGSSGSTPSTLTDSQVNIATGKNYYSLNGGVTWIEHYDFWLEPENVGYNMIRATIDDTPQSPAEYTIYLPGIAQNWSPSLPPPSPPPENIPCLFVIGQELVGQPLPLFAGCAPSTGTSPVTIPHYNSQGTLIGLDYTLRDGQNIIVYQATIDIQRESNGRIKSYGGEVSGKDFPAFTENIVNVYNSAGGLLGANVTKNYQGGSQYQMEIIEYCPNAIDLLGYKVTYNGQQKTVGICLP